MNEEDVKLLCRLYREAKDKDAQIKILSELFVVSTVKVCNILEANGLIGNSKTRIYDRFRKLYSSGKTDYEIAIECRQTTIQVKEWRVLNSLKPNIYRKEV